VAGTFHHDINPGIGICPLLWINVRYKSIIQTQRPLFHQIRILNRIRSRQLIGFKWCCIIIDPVIHKNIKHVFVQPLEKRPINDSAIPLPMVL
jgi:hypothetical protein